MPSARRRDPAARDDQYRGRLLAEYERYRAEFSAWQWLGGCWLPPVIARRALGLERQQTDSRRSPRGRIERGRFALGAQVLPRIGRRQADRLGNLGMVLSEIVSAPRAVSGTAQAAYARTGTSKSIASINGTQNRSLIVEMRRPMVRAERRLAHMTANTTLPSSRAVTSRCNA
jgi:hypothetical protein